jgi:hypothetical protein
MMKRIHLFEFEDQSWFPKLFRDYTTDFLRYTANKKGELYDQIVPILHKGLAKSDHPQIVDLASGGGGPYLHLNQKLRKIYPELKILLTDYYPNLEALHRLKSAANNIEVMENPVDARNVPEHFKGLRTQFLSFHHFRPRDARQILQNAVNCQSSIAIFEDQERSLRSILSEIYAPVYLLQHAPRIKPFNIKRLIFTYLIPIVPLTLLWDGIVSCLRTYSLKEMRALIHQLENKDTFEWEIGKLKSEAGQEVAFKALLLLFCGEH